MKSFRARLFSAVLLVLLASAAAVAEKPHQKIPPGKECSDCHKGELLAQWKAGPHGVAQVDCTVCHGNVTEGFWANPPVSRCEQCHADQVAQLQTDPFMKHKTCITCHSPHTFKPHENVVPVGK